MYHQPANFNMTARINIGLDEKCIEIRAIVIKQRRMDMKQAELTIHSSHQLFSVRVFVTSLVVINSLPENLNEKVLP